MLVVVGLLTLPAAALIVLNMIVVVLFGHAGDPFGRRELPLLFLFTFLMFALVGAGRYTVDALIRKRPYPLLKCYGSPRYPRRGDPFAGLRAATITALSLLNAR